MKKIMIKTIKDIDKNTLQKTPKELGYNFQQVLTPELDLIDWDFDQDIINQIVLWKVNRYAKLDDETFNLLNSFNKKSNSFSEELLKELLNKLLNTKGIRLPMASSMLRFKNPNLFQIIDQRVYRIIYWKEFNLSSMKTDEIIVLYIKYLKKLREICDEYNIDFKLSDRILYMIDKKENKANKIKYT